MVAARRASLSSDNSYSLPSQISWAVHKGHTICGKLALQSIRKDNVPHAAVFPFTVMPSVLYVVPHVLFSELLFINSLFVLLQIYMYILIEINFKVECSKNTHVACQSPASIEVTCDLTATELHVRCGYQKHCDYQIFRFCFQQWYLCFTNTSCFLSCPRTERSAGGI